MADRRTLRSPDMDYEASPYRSPFGTMRHSAIDVLTGAGEGVPIPFDGDAGRYRITPFSDEVGVETQDVRCFVAACDSRKRNFDVFREASEVVYALNPLVVDVDGRSPVFVVSAATTVKVCIVRLG